MSAAKIVFVNESGSKVNILWERGSCDEVKYIELEEGGEMEQPTYVGHWWCVRRASDNEMLLRCCGRSDACRQSIPASTTILPASCKDNATQISFQNETSIPLVIFWEDSTSGSKVLMATIQPASVHCLDSYCGHIFHVATSAGSCAESSKLNAASPICTCTAATKPQVYVLRSDKEASRPLVCTAQYTKHCISGFTVMLESGVLEKHPRLQAQLDGDLAEITRWAAAPPRMTPPPFSLLPPPLRTVAAAT